MFIGDSSFVLLFLYLFLSLIYNLLYLHLFNHLLLAFFDCYSLFHFLYWVIFNTSLYHYFPSFLIDLFCVFTYFYFPFFIQLISRISYLLSLLQFNTTLLLLLLYLFCKGPKSQKKGHFFDHFLGFGLPLITKKWPPFWGIFPHVILPKKRDIGGVSRRGVGLFEKTRKNGLFWPFLAFLGLFKGFWAFYAKSLFFAIFGKK